MHKMKTLMSACALIGAVAAPQLAHAQATPLSPTLSSTPAVSKGLVDLRKVAASEANHQALQATQPVQMRKRYLPDGKTTTGQVALRSRPALATVPSSPNTDIAALPPGGRSSSIIAASGFNGMYLGETGPVMGGELEPPDQGLAANKGYVFETVNNTFQIFDSTGAPLTGVVSNATFFGSGNLFLSDPHVVFVQSINRWVFEELYTDGGASDGFVMAVSTTANPLGTYNIYFVPSFSSDLTGCSGENCLPDYPQIGWDQYGLYITADLFSNVSGNFVNAAIYAIPLAPLKSGAASFSYVRFVTNDFVIQPSVPGLNKFPYTGNGGMEYLLSARNIADGTHNVRVIALCNTSALPSTPASVTAFLRDLLVESYGASTGSQSPGGAILDGGYWSFGSAVQLIGGQRLLASLNMAALDGTGFLRNILAWFDLKPNNQCSASLNATVKGQGYVVPPDGYSISYPNLALNKDGNGILGMSITNPNAAVLGGYPSTGFMQFDGAPKGPIFITGQGADQDRGFTCSSPFGPPCRWGDYGQGTVDRATGTFLTANEYIPDPNRYPPGSFANWGTFITQVLLSASVASAAP